MRFSIVIILNFVFSTLLALPENNTKLYFKHLNIKDGLSQNTVFCILQDRQGFMWFGTKEGLNRYDGIKFKTFKRTNDSHNSLENNNVNDIFEDQQGNIWTGTDAGIYIYSPHNEQFRYFDMPAQNGNKIDMPVYALSYYNNQLWISVEKLGLLRYDFATQQLEHFENLHYNIIGANISSVLVDTARRVWFGMLGKGLYVSDNDLRSYRRYKDSNGRDFFESDNVNKMTLDSDNNILVGTIKQGLLRINLTNNHVEQLTDDLFIHVIRARSDKEIWIGTESGLHILNPYTKEKRQLTHVEDDRYSLSDNAIYSIYKDREGGMWIGSFFGGIDYYPRQHSYFEKYYPQLSSNSIKGKRVREFIQDNEGNLLIGTEDGGLSRFNLKTKQFTPISHREIFTNVHGLCIDNDNNLWVGTFSRGLNVMNAKTGNVTNYRKNPLLDDNIFSLCKSRSGHIWVGTVQGVNLYRWDTREFTVVDELIGQFIFDIHEDFKGNMWFATYSNGIFCYNPANNTWKSYRHSPGQPGSLPYDKAINIYEDKSNHLWFSTTNNGVSRFNPSDETFETFMPYDMVYQIIEERNNIYWLTTNNGLVRLNTDTRTHKRYTVANGLLSNQFNYRSGLQLDDGQVFFGCIEGFISFNPETFTDIELPAVTLTNFMLYNDRSHVQPSPENNTIKLKHNQNSFSIHFAALTFISSETNNYKYKLEGVDHDWLPTGNEPMATYLDLKPGTYSFHVRVSDNSCVWVQHNLVKITITPPFWATKWAYAFYVLIFILLVLVQVYYWKKRIEQQQQQKIVLLENEKEREIHHAKIEFFTTIAHEIRTPLTLIKGPLENLLSSRTFEPDVKESLEMMEQNIQRLLTLVNQLLDFRKTEVQGFSLNFINKNISQLLRDIYQRFKVSSSQYNISFELHLPDNDFYAPTDNEAFTKIISNLLNNALKHAATFIRVELKENTDTNTFSIIVQNDGALIPRDMSENIFKPFFQLKEQGALRQIGGSGIGLSLARSLSELHGGTLTLDTSDHRYNTFYLQLPMQQQHEIKLHQSGASAKNDQPATKNNTGKPLVLVVEDNAEMQSFIVKQLQATYAILTASNGQQAFDLLDKHPVALVISDVIMPEMDGFELCERIKNNLSYSHIPIILLTAKANLQSKIKGIELGADAYIEKPFSVEYLLTRVASLLSNQAKLRKAFANSPFTESNTMGITPADKQFLEKLSEIIHKELSNPNFNIDSLADSLNMSRSSLHRKIKGIADLTPNDYIKLERLKKAAVLLREKQYQVGEISYLVGFNSPSYFAKCFQKQFGVLPKDFE